MYENLRFIDSYKFLQSSLSTLVNNLPPDNFSLLENFFKAKGHSMEKIDLLKRKEFYPYTYIDSFKKFNEPRLPARRLWTNSLAGGEVSLDQSEFNHAIMVFTKFGCNSIADHHGLYLSADVLLLASVFEAFRSVCYEKYGGDCAHYYTASNLAGDVFLKICRADLRLLTERDHLHFVEGMIRGGMSSVYARKYWKANNQYLDDHDKNEENSFIVNIDANNLYGGIMQNYSLPLNDFKWADDSVDIPKLLLTEEDSEWGYLAEVDIEFPDELHDYFKDYPPVPSKESVQITDLSTDQVEIDGKLGITSLPKVPKLIQSLQKKSGYILHYLTLQLYIELGVKVTHLHRVLHFR